MARLKSDDFQERESTSARHNIGIVALSALVLFFGTALSASAQGPPPDQSDMTIDAATRTQVIQQSLTLLDKFYVYPDLAKKMDAAIDERIKNKAYDQITSAKELAKTLTDDLRAVSHDKHLHVIYSHNPLPSERPHGGPTPADRERMREFMASVNFGFEKLERLSGNVGYLDLRGFLPPDLAGETAAAAMDFLSNTDALIIDLRKNGGGDPATVDLICSYLLGPEPVHINDLYWRPSESTQQWWTLPYVPGKRYLDKPVYVLTSHFTFSGGEEFTYDLKTQKRATIVGETTGGGAHPGGPQPINDHFALWVPTGRAINPITHDDWEGKGVSPDVQVPADQALATAHLAALRALTEKNQTGPRSDALKRAIQETEQELEQLKKHAPGADVPSSPNKN